LEEKNKKFGNNHEIISCIGKGGMGVVYKARRISLNRMFALNMMKYRTLLWNSLHVVLIVAVVMPIAYAATKENLKVPEGFLAKKGTTPESYTDTGWAKEVVHKKTGIEMVFIPAGEFMMGSPFSEIQRAIPVPLGEKPVHEVRITKPFYLGKYEVTQGQWQRITGNNLSYFRGNDSLPVEQVSWEDCEDFLRKAGDGLRFPTEAEWEYACRADSTTAYYFGDSFVQLKDYAWFNSFDGSTRGTHEVGQKRPNAWGLYDMHGNVLEWCKDWYDSVYYSSFKYRNPPDDPAGPSWGPGRVQRGGSWMHRFGECRSGSRHYSSPTRRGYNIGLRVAKTLTSGPLIRKALRPAQRGQMRIPLGFRAQDDTTAEPYTNTGWAKEVVHKKTGIEMVFIPAGEFMMGGCEAVVELANPTHRILGSFMVFTEVKHGAADRKSKHKVKITTPFYLGKHEVTTTEWNLIGIEGQHHFSYFSQPARTSWMTCQDFLRKAGAALRLPTEAEWEYACRAGSTTKYYFGNSSSALGNYAWYEENSRKKFQDRINMVEMKKPNAWGLYDMYGNVWEWCEDWYGSYPGGEQIDPKGPPKGEFKVIRGGSFYDTAESCQSAQRGRGKPDLGDCRVGFRVAKTLE